MPAPARRLLSVRDVVAPEPAQLPVRADPVAGVERELVGLGLRAEDRVAVVLGEVDVGGAQRAARRRRRPGRTRCGGSRARCRRARG